MLCVAHQTLFKQPPCGSPLKSGMLARGLLVSTAQKLAEPLCWAAPPSASPPAGSERRTRPRRALPFGAGQMDQSSSEHVKVRGRVSRNDRINMPKRGSVSANCSQIPIGGYWWKLLMGNGPFGGHHLGTECPPSAVEGTPNPH